MGKSLEIKNCYEFICPVDWDNLEKTDNQSIRFCGSCERQVFKASNKKTFHELSKQNKCVAYFSDEIEKPIYMGETVYPAFIKDIELD